MLPTLLLLCFGLLFRKNVRWAQTTYRGREGGERRAVFPDHLTRSLSTSPHSGLSCRSSLSWREVARRVKSPQGDSGQAAEMGRVPGGPSISR